MEKVFDVHVHYVFDIPLEETISIFREEFAATETEKYCFLSLPHECEDGVVAFDALQNVKGLFLKRAFSPNGYAFAGLVHPTDYADVDVVSESFLSQAKEYLSVGFDGIKMLEGYPSLLKARGIPLDSPVYTKFYAYLERVSAPIILHLANPKENWDKESASPQAIAAGRVYDDTYPTKKEITEQLFRVLDRHPKLRLILAHFGFMSDDITMAERFLSYPNTAFDVTPGGEQLMQMQKEWDKWFPFWERHSARIFYGTDFYAFPKNDTWEAAFTRRPKFLRQFFETDSEHIYLDEAFFGVALDKSLRDKIYRENFLRLLGSPKEIDAAYIQREVERLLQIQNKKSLHADNDLQYMLRCLLSEMQK